MYVCPDHEGSWDNTFSPAMDLSGFPLSCTMLHCLLFHSVALAVDMSWIFPHACPLTTLPPTSFSPRISVVEKLRDGLRLLKYGRKGKPHKRIFRLIENDSVLVWDSSNKSIDESSGSCCYYESAEGSSYDRWQRRVLWKDKCVFWCCNCIHIACHVVLCLALS